MDDPQGTAETCTAPGSDTQPEGGRAAVALDSPLYGPTPAGIRGLRLSVLEVRAKLRGFGFGLDAAAAEQQRRRLSAIGDWQAGRVPITDPDPTTTRNS